MSERHSLKSFSIGLSGFFLLGFFVSIWFKENHVMNVSNISEQPTKHQKNDDLKTSYPKVNESLKEYYPIDRFADEKLISIVEKQEDKPVEKTRVVSKFYEGLAKFEQDGKYGYVDEKGNIAVAAKYDEAGNFSEQLAAVVLDGQSFFIDGAGNVVIALDDYDAYSNYREQHMAFGGNLPFIDYLYTLSEFKNGVAEISKPKLPRDYRYQTIEEANGPKEFLCNAIDRTGKIIAEDRLCEIKNF